MMRIETRRLYIRPMTDDNLDLMSLIWLERSPTLFDNDKEFQEKILPELWKTTKNPSVLSYLIFLRDGGQFCGRVNMQKIDEEVPELGIDLLEKYQNHGYGPEAITTFANWYGENRHVSEIKVRIMTVNTRSTHVFQKLGAEYLQEDSTFSAAIKRLVEELPEKQETIMRELSVREYLLKLPIASVSDTAL